MYFWEFRSMFAMRYVKIKVIGSSRIVMMFLQPVSIESKNNGIFPVDKIGAKNFRNFLKRKGTRKASGKIGKFCNFTHM